MTEKIKIKNKRGLELAAVLHIPDDSEKKIFPVMILFHGNTGYKEEPHIATLAELLSTLGISVIRFDTSGYGESNGTIRDDYRLSNYIADSEDVYKYLKTRNEIDTSRIGVFGQSMGGIVACVFAAKHANTKCLCIVSSPYLMGTNKTEEKLEDWREKGYQERVSSRFGKIRIPYAFLIDAQKWNALDYLPQIHSPVLVMWGTADTNVPMELTRTIYEKVNDPKEFHEVKGMDHFYKRNPIILNQVNEILTPFIVRNLKKA